MTPLCHRHSISGRPAAAEPALQGTAVARLMRAHRVTIRDLAARMNITLTRMRHVRAHGVTGEAFVRDWLDAIEAAAAGGCRDA